MNVLFFLLIESDLNLIVISIVIPFCIIEVYSGCVSGQVLESLSSSCAVSLFTSFIFALTFLIRCGEVDTGALCLNHGIRFLISASILYCVASLVRNNNVTLCLTSLISSRF